MSRRMLCRRRGFSSAMVAVLNLSRNSSSSSWPRRAWISLLSHSLISSAFIVFSSAPELLIADHEARLDRQLRGGQVHGLPRGLLVDALELEHHAAGLHHAHPPFR